MLPKHIDNLLVPVAMSSTHVAMSVLRMEPVWMTTGQIAGLAAATAREKSCAVSQLDPTPLPRLLNIRTQAWLARMNVFGKGISPTTTNPATRNAPTDPGRWST